MFYALTIIINESHIPLKLKRAAFRMIENPSLTIHLLGGFRLTVEQAPVTGLECPRPQELLAYLLLWCDRPRPRRQLALFLTLYGLAVRRYISGTIVSFFISGQATGNQRAGNAAWPVAE
jgi:hypothetical protein